MPTNILQYVPTIWATADLLRGAGIKESDFPKYMMPYFALLMVESRLIRESDKLETEMGREDIDDFIEVFKLEDQGYNEYIVKGKKSLKNIVKNDTSFNQDFQFYLNSFDPETKYLLGVNKGNEEEKFLDISGASSQLMTKGILFATLKA